MTMASWADSRTQQDLVICVDHNFSFENRWRFTNDLVDYRTVEVWTDSCLTKNRSKLKRVKIYGLSSGRMDALLRQLSDTQLEQLEIDVLEIEHAATHEYKFRCLKRFSVDAIRVVDRYGEVPDAIDKVKLEVYGLGVPVSLYLGKCVSLQSLLGFPKFTMT